MKVRSMAGLGIGAVVAAAGWPIAASAQTTLRVPGDEPTIAAGIAAAVEGDTVLVAPGRYEELLEISGKSITLMSEGGAAETTIDGLGEGVTLTIVGDSTIEGFAITGGSKLAEREDGGGINVLGGRPLLRDLVISGNTGLAGGGVRIVSAAADLEGVTFRENHAATGAGLYAELSDVSLRGVRFADHNVPGNGGAFRVDGGSLEIDGLVLENNIAGNGGGGMYLNHVVLDARGIEATNNGEGEIQPGGSIWYNTIAGGAVFAANVEGRIDASRFVSNKAAYGGAIYVNGSRTLEIVNCLITDSLTAQGAILANDSSPRIVNCTVVDNNQWGLFSLRGSAPVVRNSIFSGNQIGISSIEIGGIGVADVAWTLINGDASAALGDGIVNADPMLDSDFNPMPGSPVIDAGDNGAVPEGIQFDLVGSARFVDDPETPDTGLGAAPVVDLGAIEYRPIDGPDCRTDMDGDGALTVFDFIRFQAMFAAGDPAADFDEDGVHTFFDFVAYQNEFSAGCE